MKPTEEQILLKTDALVTSLTKQIINRDSLISTAQVAHCLGVSEATIKRWADSGKFGDVVVRGPGGHRRFPIQAIAAFMVEAEAHRPTNVLGADKVQL